MSEFAPGTVLNNRYELSAELGRGGTGTVFLAHDPDLDRDVAVKILTNHGFGTAGRAQLQQEAQSIAKLNHPNIVSVYDVGELEQTPFIVMEYVEGKDLHSQAPDDLPAMVNIARQMTLALQHAHEAGVIHRDLKPENVLVHSDGTAKLVDFGIARSVASRMTTEGHISGTVHYLAPELALGQEYDGRADLYALGVMMYELSAGRLPFDQGDPLTIVSQHVNASPIPPRSRNEEISPRLEALILQLLSKDPEDRLPNAAAVTHALEDADLLDMAAAADEEMAVLGRIARGRFVGRQKELQQARTIWTQTMAGAGQTLLISGEPGIGKSSLTRELATQAEISGGKALIGECYAEGGAPYSPFSQILRKLLSKHSQNGSTIPDFVIADLISLTPELRPYFGELPELPALDPESEQRRLSESMVSLFSNLSEQSPVLLVIEDAHWADSGSLSMLRYLARRSKGQNIMVVATYREVELDEALPLQEMLVELNRERLASRLKLTRFGRDETRELLATIFQDEITDEFLEGIYGETEGNPFFVEEVCKALVEEGKLYFEDGEWHRPDMADLDIPQSVRVAIQSRLAKLPDDVLAPLRMAAVLGREFDFDTLAAATDLAEDPLVDALEQAERAQLVNELSGKKGGTFQFAHALISATLFEGLTGLRQRRMHHQAASAIEQLRPDDFDALAHHYYHSGDEEKGLEYSIKAGERALGFSALNEARRHFNRALEIAEIEGRSEDLRTIYLALAGIEGQADFYRAIEFYEKGLELTQESTERARIKVRLGSLLTVMGDENSVPMLGAAIAELDPATHGNEVAMATASMGRFNHNRGQHRKALEYLERAREIADPLGDVETLVYIYTFLAGAYQHLADFERSNQWARREIDIGSESKYALMEAVGYEYLAENATNMGHWADASKYSDLDEQIGRKNGLPDRVRWAKFCKCWALHKGGLLETAIAEGTFALEHAEANGERRLAVLSGEELARCYADMNDLDAAEKLVSTAVERASELDQAYMICMAQDSLAYLHSLRGDWASALESHEAILVAAEGTDNRLIPVMQGAGLAEALLEMDREDEALEKVFDLIERTQECNAAHYEAGALRVLGRIRAEQGDADAAAEAYSQALEISENWNSPSTAGRILLDWAALDAMQGEQDSVAGKLDRASELFESVGAAFWVAKVRELSEYSEHQEVTSD